jgi:CubicO group peptidase (beta-lactamase class C family)
MQPSKESDMFFKPRSAHRKPARLNEKRLIEKYKFSYRHLNFSACLLLFVLMFSLVGCQAAGISEMMSVVAFSAHLDSKIPNWMAEFNVPGMSIGLVRDGEWVWSEAYGFADLEKGIPMTVDAICRTESISKSVTAWGIMALAQEGRIDLDRPWTDYIQDWALPDTPYDEDVITIRQLLSHTGGMPPGDVGPHLEFPPGEDKPSLEENLAMEARMFRESGEGFMYSNPGFNMLELLVEAVTGQSFAEYMAETVLEPLGMNHASFSWQPAYEGLFPTGYGYDGTPVPPYVYSVSASGGLFADVPSIVNFMKAEMSGESASGQNVLNAEALQEILTPVSAVTGAYGVVSDHYGFGHFLERLSDGHIAAWHGGQGHGWMTHMHVIPESGDGIVILTNSQNSWPVFARILRDWSAWNGVAPVKMSRISLGVTLLRVVMGLAVIAVLWLAFRLIRDWRYGVRTLAPFSRSGLVGRLILAGLGFSGLAYLVWSALQPYHIAESLFPGVVNRAAILFGILAVLLIITALSPMEKRSENQ